MRKLLLALISVLLMVSVSTISVVSAASKEVYYATKGDVHQAPGIYKSAPNGKPLLVVKENAYKVAPIDKLPMRLGDVNSYRQNGAVATDNDYKKRYLLNDEPIQHVQNVGKDLYFTKYVYFTAYGDELCGGGSATLLNVYKRSNDGKVMKVFPDFISSNTTDQFKIIGSYMYYAKVENNAMSNLTIIKSTLDGKQRSALVKGVNNFWIQQNKIYYVKNSQMFQMGLDGKNSKSIGDKRISIYSYSSCDPGNYSVSENGVFIREWLNGKQVVEAIDFKTAQPTIVTLPNVMDGLILDMDLAKKRMIVSGSNEKDNIALYDTGGKLIKVLKTYDYWNSSFKLQSYNAKTGQILYSEGSRLKEIKF